VQRVAGGVDLSCAMVRDGFAVERYGLGMLIQCGSCVPQRLPERGLTARR